MKQIPPSFESVRGALLAVIGFIAILLLVIAGSAAALDRPYVALGDSVAAPSSSYVGLLFPNFQSQLGTTQLLNRAQGGATSGSLRGFQLATALGDINAASDTAVVTIDIGGNDRFACADQWDSCPFRGNFAATLDDLEGALAGDPGSEPFAVMAYYNPGVGTAQEAGYDRALLGANGVVGLSDIGTDVGLNDVIHQEAAARGLPVADPYPAFKLHGQAFMQADGIHPNSAGQAAIAQTFCDAIAISCELAPPPPPPPPPADASAPETQITKDAPNKTEKTKLKFRFKSSEPNSTFECKLDKRAWKLCRSPKKLKQLDEGKHKFKVRAIDAAGNTDRTPAKDKFRVVKPRRER
ncbi:MAG: hypothetical protein K0R88_1931 [Solirubrobacterales bacterium]|jgi:lysophospholipase L1-like esterase|nr:hypothetical protein [Solirubrobacterales bacterium]